MNLDKVLPTSQITNVYGVKYGSYTEVLQDVNLHMYRAMDFKALSCCLSSFFFLFLLIHLLNLHLNERKRLVESWYKHNEVSRRKIYGFSNCLYLLVFIFVFGRSFIQV